MLRKVDITALTTVAVTLLSSGCSKPQAYGEVTSIIVGALTEMWDSIADSLYAALEPRTFTVRDERTFEVTHVDPTHPAWERLRQWKQVVIFGAETDPWLEEPLEEVNGEEVGPLPALRETQDLWARGQTVTLAVLPQEGRATAARSLIERLHELIDDRFWRYAQARMFVTPPDSAAERLAEEAGFTLRVPGVYRVSQKDSIYQFRNDNPSPADLIRSVLVTWRTPPPDTIAADYVLEWRREIAERAYEPSQVIDTSRVESGYLQVDGHRAFQIQAVWVNPPELGFPAGGPLLSRVVVCPEQERTYFLDAWLYAPGEAKYEYMIQLLTILDSFRCLT